MKIDDRSDLSGIVSPGAKETGKVDSSGRSEAHHGTDRTGSDRAELSGLAGKIAQASTVDAKARAEKVERLRLEIAQGTYRPDPAAISKGIVDDAVANSAAARGAPKQ